VTAWVQANSGPDPKTAWAICASAVGSTYPAGAPIKLLGSSTLCTWVATASRVMPANIVMARTPITTSVPERPPGTTGRPGKHGPEFALARPAIWPEPAHATTTATTRYGTATATSWDRLHRG
jgi:hypothetical protein